MPSHGEGAGRNRQRHLADGASERPHAGRQVCVRGTDDRDLLSAFLSGPPPPSSKHSIPLESAAEAGQLGYSSVPALPSRFSCARRKEHTSSVYIEARLGLDDAHHQSEPFAPDIFRRIVGLSPKGFCDARRLTRFKERLRAGESISDACYGAGYGSSRALYEKAGKHLGMTPATYQRGGDGLRIHYANIGSTLGRALLAGTDEGVCAVLLGQDDETLIRQLRAEFPTAAHSARSRCASPLDCGDQCAAREDPCSPSCPSTSVSGSSRPESGKIWAEETGSNWRRERDSNPGTVSGSAVFKTAAIDHSAIPPRQDFLARGPPPAPNAFALGVSSLSRAGPYPPASCRRPRHQVSSGDSFAIMPSERREPSHSSNPYPRVNRRANSRPRVDSA